MAQSRSSPSQVLQNNGVSQLNTTLQETDRSNQLCSAPEKLFMCSRMISSGNILRKNVIKPSHNKNRKNDCLSDEDEDEVFYQSLRTKIQKDLPLRVGEKSSSSMPLTGGANSKRKRKCPFDEHSENLIKQFREDVRYKAFQSQNDQALALNSDNTINDSVTKEVHNTVEHIISTESIKENSATTSTTTPNDFKINIKSNVTSKYLFQMTSTVSKGIRSSSTNKMRTTILETETEEILYLELQCLTPCSLSEDEF